MLGKQRKHFWAFWICMFAAIFAMLCFCGYSDGDDTFFYERVHSMGFLSYLGWRYETWVGRMAAEALVYITFRLGLWFWRPMNALMLVLLPLGVLRLAMRVARGSGTEQPERVDELGLGAAVCAACGYFLMNILTVGYAAVWVNGSIFYTWSFTCGIWALTVVADVVFSPIKVSDRGAKSIRVSMEGCGWQRFCYAIPCAIVASMSIEQMGAVLLVFTVMGVLYGVFVQHRLHPLLTAQALVTVIAFVVLYTAPGNELRVASEIETWMPWFEDVTFGQHLFVTINWLLSSFANENKLFLCIIWAAGSLLLLQREEKKLMDWVFVVLAGVFFIAALLPYTGITVLSNMGMQYIPIHYRVEYPPLLEAYNSVMRTAMVWWAVALTFTLIFVWRVLGRRLVPVLIYLAGIASEAIMYFSPTIYASGARIYYLTDILYLVLALSMAFGLMDKKRRNMVYGVIVTLGVINTFYQAWTFFAPAVSMASALY